MSTFAKLGDSTLQHQFGRTPCHTVGVEEELFLVDPVMRAACRVTDAVLASAGAGVHGQVLGEMCDGVVELASPICDNALDARIHLGALRAAVLATGHADLVGVGVHPTTAYGDVVHRRDPHYDAVGEDTRGLLRQSTYCGVHVHVGMPDAETAIQTYNGMRKWVPVLQALGANSPYWFGRDSGLCSTRTVLCHAVPRTGLPAALRDWEHYSATIGRLVEVGQLDDLSAVWWDVRPHPRLGTLEIRVADSQSSLDDLEGLVALVHGLVRHESLVADGDHPPKAVLDEATFRGIRDGLDAVISVGGPMRAVRDHVRLALDLAAPHAAMRGCATSLEQVERMLIEGNGASRQRRAHAAGGMPAVLELLAEETMAGLRPRHPISTPSMEDAA